MDFEFTGKDEWYDFYYSCPECRTDFMLHRFDGGRAVPRFCPHCGLAFRGQTIDEYFESLRKK